MASRKRNADESYNEYRQSLRDEGRQLRRHLKGRHTGIWGSRWNRKTQQSQFLVDSDLEGKYVSDIADENRAYLEQIIKIAKSGVVPTRGSVEGGG